MSWPFRTLVVVMSIIECKEYFVTIKMIFKFIIT